MPFVKICGITRLDDALLAAELGARALGFVFWPGSPRFIDPFRARTIAAWLPPLVTPVGVFVDQPIEYVEGVASLVRLGAIQLHGEELPAYYHRLRQPVIKSVAVDANFDLSSVQRVPDRVLTLLDTHDPQRRGGTGQVIDWTLAKAIARSRKTILSGGLSADNVRAAVSAVQPYAVDVSSGVESAPGVKDHGRLREFFAAVGQEASA